MEEERRRRSREGTEWITDRRRNGWNGEWGLDGMG